MQDFSLEDFLVTQESEKIIGELCKQDDIDIQISYPSDFRSAKVLREVVDCICRNFGVDPKWRTRLVLIIDELNNNAIEYGSICGEVNIFSLTIKKNDQGELCVESNVSDTGNGEYAKSANDMEEIRIAHQDKDFKDHASIRGRGLFLIINQLVDSLYFRDGDNGGLIVGIQKVLIERSQKY